MELLSPSLGVLAWTLLAFIVVLFILKKLAWKPILKALNERESGIAEALASADKAKAEMASLKSQNDELVKQARAERTELLKEAKANSDAILEQAKAKAEAEASRIVADAQKAIISQKNEALLDVKNQVSVLAIDIAEKILRRELDDKAKQEAYAQQLVKEVELN